MTRPSEQTMSRQCTVTVVAPAGAGAARARGGAARLARAAGRAARAARRLAARAGRGAGARPARTYRAADTIVSYRFLRCQESYTNNK